MRLLSFLLLLLVTSGAAAQVQFENAQGNAQTVRPSAPLPVTELNAGSTVSTTASITAQNTFATAATMRGAFNLSLSGTWVATVHLQRSFDAGSTWLDVASYTTNIEDRGFEPEAGVTYRFGVKTGNFGSGTVVGRISR